MIVNVAWTSIAANSRCSVGASWHITYPTLLLIETPVPDYRVTA